MSSTPLPYLRDLPRAVRLSLAFSLFFSLIFIAATAVEIDGKIYFSLVDDAMISMRYAKNLVDGHGLVWNPGERVEGYTNFLWVLWMALLQLLPLSTAKASLPVMLSAAILLQINLVIYYRLSGYLFPHSPKARHAVVGALSVYYPLIHWTLRGMEVGILTLLFGCALLFVLQLQERHCPKKLLLLAGTLSLAVLIRDDALLGCLYMIAFACFTVPHPTRWKTIAVLVGSLAITVFSHALFRIEYYGDWLPNTYYLKVTGVTALERIRLGMRTYIDAFYFHFWPALLPAVVGLVASFFSGSRQVISAALLLAGFFCVQTAYSIYVGGDAWEWFRFANRYLCLAAPVLFPLAYLGCDALAQKLGRKRIPLLAASGLGLAWVTLEALNTNGFLPFTLPRLRVVLGMGVAALLLYALVGEFLLRLFWARKENLSFGLFAALVIMCNQHPYRKWWKDRGGRDEVDATVRVGLALKASTAPEATIAVVLAGAIPFFSERRSIDLMGKCDRYIARLAPRSSFLPGHNKWDYAYSIGKLKPDIIVHLWWGSRKEDLAYVRSLNYRPQRTGFLVRLDSQWVDLAALDAFPISTDIHGSIDGKALYAQGPPIAK